MSSTIPNTLFRNDLYWVAKIDDKHCFQYDPSILDGSYIISVINEHGFPILSEILNYHYIEGRMNLLDHYLPRSEIKNLDWLWVLRYLSIVLECDMPILEALFIASDPIDRKIHDKYFSGYTYQWAENRLNKYSPVLLYCIKFHPEHVPFILDEMKTSVASGSKFWDYKTRQLCFKKKEFSDYTIIDIVYGTLLEVMNDNNFNRKCELTCIELLKQCLDADKYDSQKRFILFMNIAHKKSLTKFIEFGKEYLHSGNLSYFDTYELQFMN
jgi:hypothetical protein